MSAPAELVKSDFLDDWWVLFEHGRPAHPSVEGTAQEWRAIARGLRAGEAYVRFKRCGFYLDRGFYCFLSPRNTVSERDHVLVSHEDALALADQIDAVITAETRDFEFDGGGL